MIRPTRLQSLAGASEEVVSYSGGDPSGPPHKAISSHKRTFIAATLVSILEPNGIGHLLINCVMVCYRETLCHNMSLNGCLLIETILFLSRLPPRIRRPGGQLLQWIQATHLELYRPRGSGSASTETLASPLVLVFKYRVQFFIPYG